jgi:hypothetical protein
MSAVVINGVEYEPVKKSDSQKQIIILHRGFVFVGDVTRDGDECVIRNAQNVRRWGTSKGLGELAQDGPKANTQLDPSGTVRYHRSAEIGAIDCNIGAWNG